MAPSVAGDVTEPLVLFGDSDSSSTVSCVTHENAVLRLEEPMPSAHCPEMTKYGHGIFGGTLRTGQGTLWGMTEGVGRSGPGAREQQRGSSAKGCGCGL